MQMPKLAGCALLCIFYSIVTPAQVPALPYSFPISDYSPHGYLDNPFHSWVLNRSGVIRSYPPLGFGFWRTNFAGSYGGGAGDHVNYLSLLFLGLRLDGRLFADTADFTEADVALKSRYHSKNMMSYDWTYHDLAVSLRFYLASEHALVCAVSVTNNGSAAGDVQVQASNVYQTGGVKWWGRDGIASRSHQAQGYGVQKVWAGGDAFVLGGNLPPAICASTDSMNVWKSWMRHGNPSSPLTVSLTGRGPMYHLQFYPMMVKPGEEKSLLLVLSRGKNESQAVDAFHFALDSATAILQQLLDEDQKFWSGTPQLNGDWPETWKHGWVYDFETLRMNVRRPIGIFHHPWDAMQVHAPRVVLGETCMDMMTLQYADPALAKEVIYGTFADAIAPNIPCVREDGSVNMVSSDGSECGTAPVWGYPFHVINALYQSTGDSAWIAALYPHLKSYIEWWLKNRTDKDGWLHCNNSWESGQDGSRRFLVAEHNEGAVADFVRTVDVEASMAEAMTCMVEFAGIAGWEREADHWRQLAASRIKNTRSMFWNGWFRDVDARNRQPIVLKDYYDVMMLAPLACGVATAEQMKEVRAMFRFFTGRNTIQWPPGMLTFTEAAWNAGEHGIAAELVASTADRVYGRTDSRHLLFSDSTFSYRIPGVANEFWPIDPVPAGGENYGWGATLPLYIIRNIIGFREFRNGRPHAFILSPSLPTHMAESGKAYTIQNLKFENSQFDLTYTIIEQNGKMKISFQFPGNEFRTVTARNEKGVTLQQQSMTSSSRTFVFTGENFHIYSLSIQ